METNEAIYTQAENDMIQEEYELLMLNCSQCSGVDKAEVKRAFELAKGAHAGQNRKTGEPYIMHPLAVTRIVSEEMRLDRQAIVAALLHDVVEDTAYTNADISSIFGNDIADLVEGLTKIERVYKEDPEIERTNIQAENFVKLLDTISINIRVIYIKIADRLHNMRTLEGMATNKQLEKAGEVLYVYAPLAHRLGLHDMKMELEDISFKYRQPEAYKQLNDEIEARRVWHDSILDTLARRMREVFHMENLDVRVKTRKRSLFSTWMQLQYQHVSLDNMENFLILRLIFPDLESAKQDMLRCWYIYGLIAQYFTIKVQKVKDWLANPRSNGYAALHGAVLSEHKWIDVQIMSERMQSIADKGYGTYSQYFNPKNEKTLLDHWLSHVQFFLGEEDKRDKTEVLDILKDNLYISDILVYTPKGETLRLPRESTVLDFAFYIHTDLGKNCIGANVNHRLQDRSYQLKNGDTIDVITNETASLEPNWYYEVNSAQAKSKLKRVFREENKERIRSGEEILRKVLSKHNIKINEEVLNTLEGKFDFVFKPHLYYKIAEGDITEQDIEIALGKAKKPTSGGWFNFPPFKNGDNTKHVKINTKKAQQLDNNFNTGHVVLKNCCHPIPGDEASGYQDDLGRIIVHRNDCNALMRLVGNSDKKIVKIDWEQHKTKTFLTRIEIKGIDRIRLVKDMIKVISDSFGMYIQAVNVKSEGSVFNGTVDIRVHGAKELQKVMKKLKNIGGMEDVSRVLNF